jgi:cation-transporting ATPase 13A3/4/5
MVEHTQNRANGVPSAAEILRGDMARNSRYSLLEDGTFEQTIVVDDDLVLTITGRRKSTVLEWIYYIACVMTGGLYYLVCRWNPDWLLRSTSKASSLLICDLVKVTNQWNEVLVVPVEQHRYGGLLATVFPKQQDYSGSLEYLSYFEYRYFKFLLNPITGTFEPNYAWVDPRWSSVQAVLEAEPENPEKRFLLFGKNQLDIKPKSDFQLIVDELLHPFFMFQIASIILWSIDDYYYYAGCILIISVVSVVSTFLEMKKNILRMQSLAKFNCYIPVYGPNRDWKEIDSENLVPGDIVELQSGNIKVLPCDLVLLTGDCIVNESILTGESLPVSKTPIPDTDLTTLNFETEEPSSSPHVSKYFLFSGTTVIRVRGPKTPQSINARSGALALVVRTGFNTTKGSLIRSMLYPKPNTFKFYRDSFRFIGVLAVIALLGFLISLYFFIKLGVGWNVIFIRALDLITIAVPPALPATMAIGTSFAIGRLRKRSIFCTSPPRVNIGGKIDLMAFDKTGTLTEVQFILI